MVSREVKLCGTEIADEPTRTVSAGALSVELDKGALRYVRYGGHEVLRQIAFLVRDENWGTFSPTIGELVVEEDADGFSLGYRAECGDEARRLVYEARVEGRGDGTLVFEVVAEPRTDFLTNRAGFIVLHPLRGVAGRPVRVQHVDGSTEESEFPEVIDPMCPFHDIRALSHEIEDGVWATCTMQGDTFEMEDQRNWSDASYKTYVRPLARPWPYVLPKGETVKQTVRLSVSRRLAAQPAADRRGPVRVEIGGRAGTLPAIGTGMPAEEARHALSNGALLKRLAPRWFVCQVDLRDGRGVGELAAYRSLGELTGAEIVLEIVTPGGPDPKAELLDIASAITGAGLKPSAVAVFPAQDLKSVLPGSPWPEMPGFEETYAAARQAFPGVSLGGGMATYFTELNRKRPPAALLDYVTHCTCPNVHAADDRSVMETMEALPYQILSTRGFMGEQIEYRIGPSQLGCRENPYGNATAPNPDNGRVCLGRIDPRQRGLFNAAWTLSYISAFAYGGISAIALGAPTGPFGHIYRKTEFTQPGFDELTVPAVYPAFHVLAGLGRSAGSQLLSVTPSRDDRLSALALREGKATTLWIANRTAAEVPVAVALEPAGKASIAVLDEHCFEQLVTAPDHLDVARRDFDGSANLGAYAVARIEIA